MAESWGDVPCPKCKKNATLHCHWSTGWNWLDCPHCDRCWCELYEADDETIDIVAKAWNWACTNWKDDMFPNYNSGKKEANTDKDTPGI